MKTVAQDEALDTMLRIPGLRRKDRILRDFGLTKYLLGPVQKSNFTCAEPNTLRKEISSLMLKIGK